MAVFRIQPEFFKPLKCIRRHENIDTPIALVIPSANLGYIEEESRTDVSND
jgi:hypothetical protein